jgi:hypothetical protein
MGCQRTGDSSYLLTSRGKATPAADIYAIGMLSWALLTGHLPSEGCLSIVEDAFGPVASIVKCCTAKLPSKGIQSAEELQQRICELGFS